MSRILHLLILLGLWICVGCGSGDWNVVELSQFTVGPVLDSGRVYVVASSFGISRTLRAYDAASGTEFWQVEIDGWEECSQLAVRDRRVLVSCDTSIHSFDAASGHLRWSRNLDGPLATPLSLQDGIALWTARGPDERQVLTLAQVDSGERILQRELEPTSLVARVGRLVVVTEGRTVLGIDAVGGQQRWTHTLTADPAGVLGSPAGVVVVTHNTLEGLDAETGVLRWSRPTEGQVAPVTLDTVLCYAEAGNLYGLEAATGKEKWQQHLPGMLNAPVLTHDIVYVHTEGGTLHALSTFDGQVLWQLDVGPPSRQVVANSERMVWVATNEIRGVDLVKKQLLKPVRIDYLRPLPEDVGIPVIRTPLTLDGTWLFGAERGRRLFMARLEE